MALQRAEPFAGFQEPGRIDRFVVDAGFVVQMRAGGAAGRADAADDVADLDVLADAHVDRRQMAVAGRELVAVVDLDHLAVAAVPAGGDDGAGGGGAHRIAGVAAHVHAGVHRRTTEERIGAHAERGAYIDLAGDRLAHRNMHEDARIAVRLRARDGDAIDELVERVGTGARRLHRDERPADRIGRLGIGRIDAEIGEDAAHVARALVEFLFHAGQRADLALLDPLHRVFGAGQRAFDAAGERAAELAGERGATIRCRCGRRVVVGDRRGLGALRMAAAGDRAGDDIARAEGGAALLQHLLAAHQRLDFALDLLLIEQLPAGDAVDLAAQFGDAILIGELHLRLTADQAAEDIVLEGEIGTGAERPDAHHHQRADDDPERDRPDPDLPAVMNQGVVVVGAVARRSRMRRARLGGGGLAGVVIGGRQVGHRRSLPD